MSRRQTRISSRSRPLPFPSAAGHRRLLLALALAAGFGGGTAQAQPSGAQAIHGSATLSQQGSRLVVTTQNGAGTAHSAIDWQSFSIPAGTSTHFAQPGATSTSINRVLGPDPSAIFGTLSSNGRLVLVNPAGIAVGAGAVVDTAGFTASTLRMGDADAIAGRLRFGDGSAAGPLRVDGQVLARSGDVALIGSDVQTGAQALVQSPQGATLLAAGRKVELTGRGLEGIVFQVQAPSDQAVNLGTLRGDAVGVFAGTLRHSGLVQADAVSTEGGKVVLKAAGGDALVAGTVRAQAADGRGGTVDVLGERVGLLAGAWVDASGANGGGQVRVGGDYQGANAAVPNARRTFVDAQARIQADAMQQGDGGRVIVWSDEVTRMHGQISARGGAQGGDGGFAEVSGKQQLEFTGLADLRAPQGSAGTLLLDPVEITIVRSDAPDPPLGSIFESVGPVTLTDTQLIEQLRLSHLAVKTSPSSGGQIMLEENADVTWDSGNDLSLQADGGITLAGTIRADVNTTTQVRGGLHLQANGAITQPGTGVIVADRVVVGSSSTVSLLGANRIGHLAGTASGDFFVKNAQTLSVGSVSTAHASSWGITAGSVRLETTSPGADIDVTDWITATSGSIALDAGGSITGYGVFDTVGGSSGSVRLQARGGDVEFDSIYAYDLGEGSAGGNVDVLATGSIRGNSVELGGYFYIDASGGSGAAGGAGGKGGNVTLRFGGALGSGGIVAYGGDGGSGENTSTGHGGVGGQGGSITIEKTAGDLVLGDNYFAADGGYGGTAAAAAGDGGNGGAGGSVVLKASGKVILDSPSLSAWGGWGGWSPSTGAYGADGALGSVSMSASSVEVMAGSYFNVYGSWTHSGVLNLLDNAGVSIEGSFHNLGEVNLHDGAWMDAYGGFYNAGLLKAVSGSSYATLTQNTGTVEVGPGAALMLSGLATNAGTIRVDGTLELSASDPCTVSMCEAQMLMASTPGAFTNEATGTLAGTGVISVDGGFGTIDNFGTIAPGSTAGSVGTLSIAGNLTMQSGSVLSLDLQNALSHDVLDVWGAVQTGGAVQVTYAPGAAFAPGESVAVLLAGTALDGTQVPVVNVPELAPEASPNALMLRAIATVPAPAPGPAPAPVSEVDDVLQQLQNQILAFLELFAQQQQPDEDELPMGRDDIVVTGEACKPA